MGLPRARRGWVLQGGKIASPAAGATVSWGTAPRARDRCRADRPLSGAGPRVNRGLGRRYLTPCSTVPCWPTAQALRDEVPEIPSSSSRLPLVISIHPLPSWRTIVPRLPTA